ncbi:hypothetical protein ACHAP8_008955 [Fusarium lateritium]
MSTIAAGENGAELPMARIVDTAKSCLVSFQKCLNDVSKAEKAGSVVTKPSIVRIEDQLARFSLWTANLRVFSTNRDSLDSRLREAPDVRYAISSLLETLDHHLKTSASILLSITPDSNLEYTEKLMVTFGDSIDGLRNDITLLHKISNTIRRASKETQNIKASKDFIIEDAEGNDTEPFLRQLFTNYIHDRFPGINDTIRIRLADSMVLRRKRILYRRKRYGTASIRLPEPVAKPVISHPRFDNTNDETHVVKRRAVEAPARSNVQSLTKTATTLSPANFKKAVAPSVISVSKTVALSGAEELSFPPAPTASLMRRYNMMKREIESDGNERDHELYKKAAPFEDGLYHCPWEGQLSCNHQPVKLLYEYHKFIDYHLKPYRCKADSCEDVRFTSTASLLRHERKAHRPGPQTLKEKGGDQEDKTIERMKRKKDLSEAWNSCVEAVAEVTCPYCFHVIPIRDVIDEKKWKMHVKDDLDPYVCLFEECESSDHLYSHSGQWIKHMRDHTLRWRCKSKAHEEFTTKTRADYIQHMNTCHPGKFKDAQLAVLADRGALTGGPLFTACPLCGIDKTETTMESHVVSHMRLLALKSLPVALDDTDELEDDDDQRDTGDTSHSHSRSTIKDALEDTAPLSPPVAAEDWDDSHEYGHQVPGQGPPISEHEKMSWDHVTDKHSYSQKDDPLLQPFIHRMSDTNYPTNEWNPLPGAMFSRSHKRAPIIWMDPDCAICRAPASMACDCEAKGLDIAVKQAEDRVMRSVYQEIREWATVHAQDYVKQQATLNDLDSHNEKNRQKDVSGQGSGDEGQPEVLSPLVHLPKVLEYYFGLVELTLPAEDEAAVKEPPLSKLPDRQRKLSEDRPDVENEYSSDVSTSTNPSKVQRSNAGTSLRPQDIE